MAAYVDFLPYCMPFTKHVSEAQMLMHLRDGAQAICNGLALFRDDVERTVDSEAEGYLIPSPRGFYYSRIYWLRVHENRREYEVRDKAELSAGIRGDGLVWKPTVAFNEAYTGKKAYLRVVRVPNDDAEVPDVLYRELRELVGLGALARLSRDCYGDERRDWQAEYAREVNFALLKYDGARVSNGGNMFRTDYSGGGTSSYGGGAYYRRGMFGF